MQAAVMRTVVFRDQIKTELAKRLERNPRYSLRSFAKAIGISPGTLSQVLSGNKIPSTKLARKLIDSLDLNPSEQKAFMVSLAGAQQKRNLQRLAPVFAKYTEPQINGEFRDVSLDLFRIIADWYHYAILELSLTEDFCPEPSWIAKELGIRETEARLAIDRLLSVGLLKEENNSIVKSDEFITTSDKHLTNSALKRHQRQVLEKAVDSLENDPIEARNVSSMTMAIDPALLPAAREMIETFSQNLCAFLESGRRKQVYELGVVLYPIQQRSRRS